MSDIEDSDLTFDLDLDSSFEYNMEDDSWIKEFEKKEELYQDFYADDIFFTKLHFVYVDRENAIEKITEENFLMSVKNQIERHELIQILKRVTTVDNNKYSLLSILKCNIQITQDNVKNFLSSNNLSDFYDDFVTPIKNIDTIYFEKSINMFQDLTDVVFILYKEDRSYSQNTTKRVYISKLNKKPKNKTKKQAIII
jgi:hypothetical protein